MNINRSVLFLVIAATVLLTALYFFWYWISPISSAFQPGRLLFISYLLVALFWLFIRRKKSCLLNSLSSSLVIFFFLTAILYFVNFVSSILDHVEHDGVQYYLTYSHEPFDGWQDYDITARKGLFHYNSHGLGFVLTGANLKLKYDATISKMTVIETERLYGREILFSIEEENPLFYEAFVELNNYVYYLFSSCRQMGVDCQNQIYSLYKCKLDNTYCERLPFMYSGEYGGSPATLVGHETTSEIEVYFESYCCKEQESREVLIYSYGYEPHCYVENCYIQNKP